MDLNEDQQFYIQTVYDYFCEKGSWPTFGQIEKIVHQTHPDFQLTKVLGTLNFGFVYGYFFSEDLDHSAMISLSAIRLCKNSNDDLYDFVRVICYCAEKYYKSGVVFPEITSDELQNALNLSELSAKKVGWFLRLEKIADPSTRRLK